MRSFAVPGIFLSIVMALPAQSYGAKPVPGQLASAAPPTGSAFDPSLESAAGPPRITVTRMPDSQSDTVKRIWIESICAVLAASAFDAATSWGKQESNPLLSSPDGTFGARGLAIKASIAGAVLIPQLLLRRHKEFRKSFIVANFADAAVFMGASIHNLGVSGN